MCRMDDLCEKCPLQAPCSIEPVRPPCSCITKEELNAIIELDQAMKSFTALVDPSVFSPIINKWKALRELLQ